ncbi:MAG: hypothetical protein ACI9HK_000505 [Pirellulaceae bacterium]|jgi:hypothetical protein
MFLYQLAKSVFAIEGILAEEGEMGLSRIPSDLRGPSMLIIALIILVGFTLIGFTWWWGRFTRRYMNSSSTPQTSPIPSDDDWATKPIVPPVDDNEPQ